MYSFEHRAWNAFGHLAGMFSARFRLSVEVRRLRRAGVPEFGLLPYLCDKSGISLDVGANIGTFSKVMGQHSRTVLAFEPNPTVFSILQRSAAANVTPMHFAVGEHLGIATLNIPSLSERLLDGHASLSQKAVSTYDAVKKVQVRITTLDDLSIEDVYFVKIDVEGLEIAVLRGGEALIRHHLPHILVESENRHDAEAPMNTIELLTEWGYKCYFLIEKCLHEVDQSTILHQINNIKTGYLVKDFLFIHQSKTSHTIEKMRNEFDMKFAHTPD